MYINRNGPICFSKADTSCFRSYGANSFEIENLDKSGQKFPSNDSLQPESTKVAEHSVDKKILAKVPILHIQVVLIFQMQL